MKRRKVDNEIERQLLTALIVSKDFLGQASGPLTTELNSLQDVPLFRLIADWCLTYFNEYRDAPKAHIETVYQSWADKETVDEDLVDGAHDLLEGLSDQYETGKDFNVPFLLDKLSEFLTKRKLQTLQEELDGLLSQGDAKTAAEAVSAYRSVQLAQTAGADPLRDKKVWERAFADPIEPLIYFPGAAGKFFNYALTRDSLIGIQAPEKRGKTWWCLEFAIRALRNRKKVALFSTGDLSEGQLHMRLGVRWANRPLHEDTVGVIHVPKRVKRTDEEDLGVELDYEEKRIKAPISFGAVEYGRRAFMRACGLPKTRTYFKTSCHSNSSINVKGINAILDQWAVEEGFIPDVVIIDYADILAPEENKKEGRDMINDTWKALRRMTQDRHVLGIVPTQASAAAYEAQTQGMKHFSNDKRKLAHVTGMFALNQTEEEKEAQVMRLNWIVLRESPFNVKRCLYVGQCLTLGRAFCCATL